MWYLGRTFYGDIRFPLIKLIDLKMQKIPEDKIHVTGFGPFRGFATSNPSWDAVSQLPDYIEHNGQSIEIIKHEIPVTYYDVDKKWHEIWSTKPRVINF